MGRIRSWLARRKERKAAKYAEEAGWMDRGKLQRLREQQSPLRGGRRRV
jgi:hypothetical protein